MKRTATLVIAAALFAPGALAQSSNDEGAGSACADIVLTSPRDSRVVAYHQIREDGKSLGDLRVGKRDVFDADNNPAGNLHWRIQPTSPTDDPHAMLVNTRYFILNDGLIITETLMQPRSELQDTSRIAMSNADAVIMGGTGAYEFAVGTVSASVAEDGSGLVTYTFNMEC